MYILATLFFVFNYLSYKFLFLRWNQTSDLFNEEVALTSISIMKWALLFHLAMALIMFSNKRVLTPAGYTPEQHYRPKGEPAGQFFKRRFDQRPSIYVVLIVIAVLGVYLFYRTLIKTILDFLSVRRAKNKKNMIEQAEEQANNGDLEAAAFKAQLIEDSSEDFYRELNITYLRAHYVRANK
jgi:hypothetical protein